MPLCEEQRSFYRQNGYLVIENAIPESRLQPVRTQIAHFIEMSKSVRSHNSMFDLGSGHTAERPAVRRLKQPHRQHPMFDELMRCDEIIDPVAELLGGKVRFDHSKLNFKPANSDASIKWHQDWAFYPHSNDDLLAVGVMIKDCTEDNGPLMVIPGSHKGPIYNHHHNGLFAGGIHDEDIGSLLKTAVTLTAPAGSISIHHVRILHASENNRTNTDRPLLLFSYAAVDAFPVFDTYDIAEFDSRIIRGQPTLEGRMEAVPFRIHYPSVAAEDSIYENQARITQASAR